MDNFIYTAMTGAKGVLLAQTNNANNLSNVSTFGFKADIDHFLSEPVYGPGYPTRVYAEDARAGFDASDGNMIQTDYPLDIAINGGGWIGVQDDDGALAYTRRGDLRVSPDGILANGEGRPIVGNNGAIAVPINESVIIGSDGTVSVRPLGAAPSELVTIDRIMLVQPPSGAMEKGVDGLFRSHDQQAFELDATVRLVPGAIETSNVNPVHALVNMIEYGRSLEAQVKFFQVAEDMDSQAARIMSIS